MYVCIYKMYVCAYIYIYIYIYIYTYIFTYMTVKSLKYGNLVKAYTHALTLTHVFVHIKCVMEVSYTHAYIHTKLHVCIHTYRPSYT